MAGTLPTLAGDGIRLNAGAGSPSSFSIEGKAGRIYTFQRSTTLLEEQWQDLDTRGPLAEEQVLSFEDPEPPSGASFYRLTVRWPGRESSF